MRDGTDRSFEVDHLATYTSKSGKPAAKYQDKCSNVYVNECLTTYIAQFKVTRASL